MAEKKRQCGTCRFFVEKEASGHGKCTHPKRAGTDADLLLLRPTELACRTQWGDSLWQDPADDSDPMEPKSPQQPTLPEPIAAQLQFDDEVTSVSIAGSKTSRSSFEDDVVDTGVSVTGMASWNDPVQDERLDLLRKSSHDALAGARKRHMEKQARQRELIPFAEDDEAITPESTPETEQTANSPEPAAEKSQTFPPDDFVEEERTATEDDTALNDELVDKGVSPDRNRSPRMRKLLRNPNDPKKNEAMRASVPAEMRVTSNNPEHREQWNSVPTLNPGFELPLSQPSSRPPASNPIKLTASAAPTPFSTSQSRPVSQAREMLSEDRLRQERAQRQMVAPLDDSQPAHPASSVAPAVVNRPRLTEAPAHDTAPLEQIKSSPLRGYHPATRKLIQQPQRDERSVPQKLPPPPIADRKPQSMNTQPAYDASPQQRSHTQPGQRPKMQGANERPPRIRAEQHPVNREPTGDRERKRPYIPLHQADEEFRHQPIEIAPNVSRKCGTCASYRPSDIPGRGSCTNALAGPVQRVVYVDDLACQRSFGSFWIPADHKVWLKELPDHSAPTPRVDAMLARKRRREKTVLPDLDELTS